MVPQRCEFRSNVKYGFMGHKRKVILQKGLDDSDGGALVIDVELRFCCETPPPQTDLLLRRRVWYPNNKRQRRMMLDNNVSDNGNGNVNINGNGNVNSSVSSKLFRSPEFSNVTFIVGKKKFHAHKCILALRARTLLELVQLDVITPFQNYQDRKNENDKNNNNNNVSIRIPQVDETTFEQFLEYIYTSNEPKLLHALMKDFNANAATSLLIVADKFGSIDLKLYVESVLVDRFLTVENCPEMLMFADSHSCALLKEYSMNLYVSNPIAVMATATESWTRLMESPKLLSELLIHTTTRKAYCHHSSNSKINDNDIDNNNDKDKDKDDVKNLTIASLRDRLEEAGLDLDGSREILVNRLKVHVFVTHVSSQKSNSQ